MNTTPAPSRSFELSAVVQLLCVGAFLAVGYWRLYSAFSFQLGILIVHFSDLAHRRSKLRLAVAAFYLGVLVALGFDNKREIAMALFAILFLEVHWGRHPLRLNLGSVARFATAGAAFFGLILVASVLRGYGNFDVGSLTEAVTVVPRYVRSDVFLDGITDNLELNYGYGSAITSIDLALKGEIPYQFGASLGKVLFLPVPRELVSWKPESVMQIYTKTFAPALWAEQGSLPVSFPSEMFVNFGFLGLAALGLVWLGLDGLHASISSTMPRSFRFYSAVFLTATVLILARGGGLEQYVLYYALSTPVLLVAAKARLSSHGSMPNRVAPPAAPESAGL